MIYAKTDAGRAEVQARSRSLSPSQRQVLADGKLINVAAPAGRQYGEYLYSATVTLLREDASLYTTAPYWASVEIR